MLKMITLSKLYRLLTNFSSFKLLAIKNPFYLEEEKGYFNQEYLDEENIELQDVDKALSFHGIGSDKLYKNLGFHFICANLEKLSIKGIQHTITYSTTTPGNGETIQYAVTLINQKESTNDSELFKLLIGIIYVCLNNFYEKDSVINFEKIIMEENKDSNKSISFLNYTISRSYIRFLNLVKVFKVMTPEQNRKCESLLENNNVFISYKGHTLADFMILFGDQIGEKFEIKYFSKTIIKTN